MVSVGIQTDRWTDERQDIWVGAGNAGDVGIPIGIEDEVGDTE